VTSFNRPEGNVTGISLLGSQLEAKRLELLHELVPRTASIGVLINPKYPDASTQLRELEGAASAVKRQIHVARASSEAEIDAAVAFFAQQKVGAMLATQDPFFNNRREQLVALTVYYKWPAIFNQREFAEAGALISYGTHFREGYRHAGVYLGKILKGAKTGDLPVVQPTKFELVINLRTAKALGLTVPLTLQASADEVIE
jgi:putative tryptophan/tyrosine transport system substrate-binding protein